MKSLLRFATSLRTTIVLLCLLAVLLLLNVVVPQVSVVGVRAIRELADASASNHFILVTLGLSHLSTSPIFLGVLGLFFVQLAVVLIDRAGPTWRRTLLRPRSAAGLEAWTRTEENLSAPLPEVWNLGVAIRTLRGYGYQAKRVDDKTVWGVKHRTAPLGFLLFHLSFFLMCAGAVLLYYTRFQGSAVLTEGQRFSGSYDRVLRQPPYGQAPDLTFTVDEVETGFERGEPTHLGAVFRFEQAGTVVERRARINHPAQWGSVSVLVTRAGLAPVLWLQDDRGFTSDRVVVAATSRGDEPTEVPLAEGAFVTRILPLERGEPFPERNELAGWPIRLQVMRSGDSSPEALFEGALRPGEAASLGDARLVLEEIRLWVDVMVVSERGGGLLITGFLAGVVGLVWRLLLHRREIALTWDDEVFRLVGRSESYPWRFQQELATIFSTLRSGGPYSKSPRSPQEVEP